MGNNSDVDLLARNAALALTMCGRTGVPVIPGASKPLRTEYHGHSGILVHGENGLGGVPHPVVADESVIRRDYPGGAAQFIVDTCSKFPGEIVVITLGCGRARGTVLPRRGRPAALPIHRRGPAPPRPGPARSPLTNLGRAIELCPDLGKLMARHVMMGGAANGRGNKSPAAEANIHNDPEAAALVFDSLPQITMAGLDATRQLHLAGHVLDALLHGGEVGRFLHAINQHYVRTLTAWGAQYLPIHDATAVLAVVRPDLFKGHLLRVKVETQGEVARGATVADWNRFHWADRPPQTWVITIVDSAACEDLVISRCAPGDCLGPRPQA